MDLVSILSTAAQYRASDVHLTVGCPPLVRVSGEITELPGFGELDSDTCKSVIYAALFDDQKARFEEQLELDCSISVPQVGRFRMNVLSHINGVEAVLRVIHPNIPSPEAIGLGPVVVGLAELPRGMFLVTGPTGSGKSTTVASLIEHINQNHRKHILTIEDPIEFVFKRYKSIIRQREIGPHARSFQEALRHAMRQDPDVIFVGEMRDLETISLALTAAETGHLCIATLHTQDAGQTVDRIVDVFPAGQQQQVRVQLAATLKGIVSQVLLTRKDGRGRVAAREVLLVTPAVANLVREGKNHMIPGVIETSGKIGMTTLDKSLEEQVRRGLVELNEALGVAQNPTRLAAAFKS